MQGLAGTARNNRAAWTKLTATKVITSAHTRAHTSLYLQLYIHFSDYDYTCVWCLVPLQAPCAGVAHLVGVQRTAVTWLVNNLQYVLSTFELFLVLLSLSWLLRWADFFAFYFLSVGSCRLHSALVYPLRSANTYVAKGQLRCPLHPPLARNVVPTLSCNAMYLISCPGMSANWHFKRGLKLAFLSDTTTWHSKTWPTHTYIIHGMHYSFR